MSKRACATRWLGAPSACNASNSCARAQRSPWWRAVSSESAVARTSSARALVSGTVDRSAAARNRVLAARASNLAMRYSRTRPIARVRRATRSSWAIRVLSPATGAFMPLLRWQQTEGRQRGLGLAELNADLVERLRQHRTRGGTPVAEFAEPAIV